MKIMTGPHVFQLPAFFQPLWTTPKAIKNSSCCTAAWPGHRCDRPVLSTSQVYPQPQWCQPYTSPESSSGKILHLHPRSRRTGVPCPPDETTKASIFQEKQIWMRWEFWISEFGNRKSFGRETHLFDTGFPNSSWIIDQNSFSEVSSAVATKEDVSPLQARISLTSQDPREIWQLQADFNHTSKSRRVKAIETLNQKPLRQGLFKVLGMQRGIQKNKMCNTQIEDLMFPTLLSHKGTTTNFYKFL